MAKNVEHIQHVKSNVVVEMNGVNVPKLPNPSALTEGEIAINFASGYETISLKNNSGDVITFSSDNYYTELKLGSGFTSENSANTVTKVIEENEKVVSTALNDLKTNKLDASAYTPTDLSNYYTKSETSGKTELETAFNNKQNTLTAGTGIDIVNDVISAITDQVIDSGTSASTNAVETQAVYNFVTSYTPSITVDQVLDGTTSASTNPVSSKAVYDAIVDTELVWTNAYVAMSGEVSAHTANTEIHVTAADKEKLHTHSNKSALDSISGNVGTMAYENKTSYSSATEVNTALGNKANTSDLASYADSVKYNDTSHYVEFYHGTTAGTKVFEFDASDFIIDGMVDDVRIEDVAGSGTCLVVDFNTASGKQDINIPISDIFDANNYYTKDDVVSAITPSNSASTAPIATKVVAENELVVTNALTDLDDRKLDASAYTPTDLSNYYTKDETSGKTEISNALGAKVNSATYTGHTADTTIHFTTGDVQTQIDNSISGKVNTNTFDTIVGSGYTNTTITDVIIENEEIVSAALTDLDERKLDASAYTPTDLSNYYTKSETSGATEISDALNGKSDTSHTHASSAITSMDGYTMAASGVAITTADTLNQAIGKLEKQNDEIVDFLEEKELAISAALTDLDDRKLDASAYTPTDLTNYYTKSETSGKTEISTALGTKVNSATFTAHTADTTVHFTSGEKAAWNSFSAATDASIADLSGQSETVATALVDLNGRTSTNEEEIATLSRRTRKNFTTSGSTYFINTLKSAIADQNLEKYGLKVGDYITINTYDYVIAGLNTMRGTVTPYRVGQDHVGLIVIPHATHAWNTSNSTSTSQNTHSTGGTWTIGTAGAGYASCDLQYYLEDTVLPHVKTDLGSANILSHYKLYSNAVNTSGYNRFGDASGCASSLAWYANQEICALSEVQVYGSTVWSSSGYDTGEACRQLDVFRVYNMNEIFGGEYPWLRDIASASFACYVDHYGIAYYSYARIGRCVAALILFA